VKADKSKANLKRHGRFQTGRFGEPVLANGKKDIS
jgi:hypothetical protein